jgi:hypothetical protein
MTKNEFAKVAKNLSIEIDGTPVVGTVKVFSTGSVGWNANGRVVIKLPNGELHKCQLSCNLIVNGSKEWDSGVDGPPAVKAEVLS